MNWRVVALTKKQCEDFVVNKHYSRRASTFWAGYGLVINNKVEGVVVYGQPSPAIQLHAFKQRNFRLYELTRLVIQTDEKNAASFLIGNSLKLLEKPSAVVSYADSEYGHAGIVYQATNWLYTGSTVSHDHAYIIDGKRTHPITLRDRGITDPKRWAKENGIETVRPMRKHRYFYFNGSRSEKASMLKKLAYKVVSQYPKMDRGSYDDGPRIEMKVGPEALQ